MSRSSPWTTHSTWKHTHNLGVFLDNFIFLPHILSLTFIIWMVLPFLSRKASHVPVQFFVILRLDDCNSFLPVCHQTPATVLQCSYYMTSSTSLHWCLPWLSVAASNLFWTQKKTSLHLSKAHVKTLLCIMFALAFATSMRMFFYRDYKW